MQYREGDRVVWFQSLSARSIDRAHRRIPCIVEKTPRRHQLRVRVRPIGADYTRVVARENVEPYIKHPELFNDK